MFKSTMVAILCAFSCVSFLQADFIAYQVWTNPKTGQILEEYYDLHITHDAVVTTQQLYEIITDARLYDQDILVVVEDADTYLGFSKSKFPFYSLLPSPLAQTEALCQKYAILVDNIECRSLGFWSGIDKKTKDALSTWQQELPAGSPQQLFYAACKETGNITLPEVTAACAGLVAIMQLDNNIAWKTVLLRAYVVALQCGWLFKKMRQFIDGIVFVDAKGLHAIMTTDKKYIKLAAGGAHIAGINIVLYKEGWIPSEPVVSTLMDPLVRQGLAGLFDYQNYTFATLMNRMQYDYRKAAEHESLWNRIKVYFDDILNSAAKYPVDLQTIHAEKDLSWLADKLASE